MLKIGLSGCNGRMGQVVTDVCELFDDFKIVSGFDINTKNNYAYPVYADPFEFAGDIDVIIDFSNPLAIKNLLSYCIKRKLPIVICSTGFCDEQLEMIKEASEKIPIFKSANMSIGINLIVDLIEKATKVLEGYDIEIIEKHHNKKIDSPSGTAIMLAEAAASCLPYEAEYVYDRHDKNEKRNINEIGIHSVRGGTIVGEHEIIFAGINETVEIKHSILSRDVFAVGALNASKFLVSQKQNGFYDMRDFVNAK